ncbi:MAG: nucleotide sugar dehydrogenase [Bacillota bacterium]|jgi:UDP-N-acetyl-D-glucosamine dehydrogenase|nr:nucleotide sugar dehydrogenase [Clostridia bacterium]
MNFMDYADLLKTKIKDRSAKVAVMGLGYVGLPLALEGAKAGFQVIGIDRDGEKVERISQGKNYLLDISEEELKQTVSSGHLIVTGEFCYLKEADIIVICVPTPLNIRKEPDVSYIKDAVTEIVKYRRRGQLITLESTSYPGTTEELIAAPLMEAGLTPGQDVFIAFAPERLDPGNKKFYTRNIPKVVGGETPVCLKTACCFYGEIINEVKPVSSPRVAEMTKILENTYRAVNISLVNELMLFCDQAGIDIWEVIEAAATKPFGIQTFYPGPGIGGHCISVDPFYLSWKAKEYGFHLGFIEWAGRVNNLIIRHVVDKVADALNKHGKCLNGAKILVIGVAYKKDIGDTRESPALVIAERLLQANALIKYFDPYVPEIKLPGGDVFQRISLTEAEIKEADCVLVITDHSSVDYDWLVSHASLIVDTRNALRKVVSGKEKIIRI